MAVTLVKRSATTTALTVRLQGLTYNANQYASIDFLLTDDNGYVNEFYQAPPTGAVKYKDCTFSSLTHSHRYYVECWIVYGTTSYYYGVLTVWTRPTDYGGFSISSGSTMITASQWNAFLDKIGYMRSYKGLSWGSFSYVSSGDNFAATRFNEARTAINDMSPPTAVPSAVSAGGIIYASALNGLVTSLNSIV